MVNATDRTIWLTSLEQTALGNLFRSAEGNGHDFGITQEHGLEGRTACGIVANLVKKGVIHRHEKRGGFTQFTWALPVETVRALCAGVVSTGGAEAALQAKDAQIAQLADEVASLKEKVRALIALKFGGGK